MPGSMSTSSFPAKLTDSFVISMYISSNANIAARCLRRRCLNTSIISFNGTVPPYSLGRIFASTFAFSSSRFLSNCEGSKVIYYRFDNFEKGKAYHNAIFQLLAQHGHCKFDDLICIRRHIHEMGFFVTHGRRVLKI